MRRLARPRMHHGPGVALALLVGAATLAGPSACSSSSDSDTKDDGSGLSEAGAANDAGQSGLSDAEAGASSQTDADAEADADAGASDPCASQAAPACPTMPAGLTEGSGLHAIDRCAFPMKETSRFTSLPGLVTALEGIATHATMATVLGDLNRDAGSSSVPGSPPGVYFAFAWNSQDEDATTWIPQGITGAADASPSGLVEGKQVLLVSWYYTPPSGSTYEKGVRVAFVDVTNPAAPTYRFALLVEPTGTAAAPDFAPINLHAGGIAWFGDRLYVAETGKGFRVFDMSRMMQVATDVDSIGCAGGTCRAGLYKYVIPEIGAYASASACSPIFSYVSLDRTSTPPALVSGEYCSTSACSGPLAGRVFRWPLDTASGRLAGATSWPSEAYYLGQKQVQGAASRDGLYFLSSSAPAGGAGALYRVKGSKSATSKWIDSPEDLMVDDPRGLVFSLSEAAGSRVVVAAHATSYPAP